MPKRKSCYNRFFLCFSLQDNISKLIYARSKETDKSLNILNGVRVLSMWWIILSHTFYYFLRGPLMNPNAISEFLESFPFSFVNSGQYSVDIFFWMTGFLSVYIMLVAMTKRNGKMQNALLIYLHRFLRLIPMYSITLLFYWFIIPKVGDGPIFYLLEERAKDCNKYWWSHLLFINNLYPWYGEVCMGWTWYLGNDFQFFLLIPLFVWTYYHNRKVCIAIMCFIQLSWYWATFVLAYLNDLNVNYKKVNVDFNTYYYWRPWGRIGPFMIGAIWGCFLYSFKFEVDYNSQTKRMMDKINSSLNTRIIMYIFGALFFWTFIFVTYPINKHPEKFSLFFNALYITFSRSIFIVGVALVLMPVLMGHGYYLRRLLSLDIFVPLARLTFGAYMVHPTFMLFEAFNAARGQWAAINKGILYFLGWTFTAFLTSLVLTLLVETPCMNVEKEFLMGGTKPKNFKPRKRSHSIGRPRVTISLY